MQIAIFIECLIIIGLLVILLLRKQLSVSPTTDTAAISEENSKVIWNTSYDIEDRFKQNPIVKMHNNEGEPENLRVAFEQAAQISIETGQSIRQQNFYGAPACLESYCANASRWYFSMARNYKAWAELLEKEEQTIPKNPTGRIVKGAIEGAIRGYLGDWLGIFSKMKEDMTPDLDNYFSPQLELLEADRDRLRHERAHLNSECLSVQKYLVAMFKWEMGDDAESNSGKAPS